MENPFRFWRDVSQVTLFGLIKRYMAGRSASSFFGSCLSVLSVVSWFSVWFSCSSQRASSLNEFFLTMRSATRWLKISLIMLNFTKLMYWITLRNKRKSLKLSIRISSAVHLFSLQVMNTSMPIWFVIAQHRKLMTQPKVCAIFLTT